MGLMHVGGNRQSGGRAGESAAVGLSSALSELGLELGRFKTGTPPRLLRRTIDFGRTERQSGDEPVPFMSFWLDELFHVERHGLDCEQWPDAGRPYPAGSVLDRLGGQLPCHITYTTPRTAEVIRANLDRSPLYGGAIQGVGPRYCPSIEDKIVKFPHRERHQVFLEPEGIATEEIYVNGLSTSLPFDVQFELVRTVVGCENAEIMRPGYAVEYDFVLPSQISASMETKCLQNLFLAGQINGTSGYEEAAAQGLMAGINSALRAQGKQPLILHRDQAYIGVLVDDLVTKGITEPYRMFTSRAEYRLLLRQDNADLRLCDIGFQIGLLPKRKLERATNKRHLISAELERLAKTRHGSQTLEEILRRPEVSYKDLPEPNSALSHEVIQQVEVETKYRGYIERQSAEVRRLASMEGKRIPAWVDYTRILGLRSEAAQKLQKCRPATIGQASRMSGVTPADVSLLVVWLKRAPIADGEDG
jgi:tRNA uridine 5-carboxymethylaminomethyl modification enzyme